MDVMHITGPAMIVVLMTYEVRTPVAILHMNDKAESKRD